MEATSQRLAAVQTGRIRLDGASAAAFAIPFVLILYLALRNGGYDLTERSEVGIALWWLLAVGAAVGALTLPRGPSARNTLIALGLLGCFAVWTALSMAWTGSDERTVVEIGRVATYLAAFTVAITQQAADRWRAVLAGVLAAVAMVIVLAALSRMFPASFPEQTAGQILTGAELERRLAYPLNYSSGLAALAALAVPLLLSVAAEARAIAIRAGAAALLPVCALVLWLTGSSLALPFLLIGLTVYLLLTADRLPQLLTLTAAAAGSTIVIAAANQREALDRGLVTDAAISEGRELLAIALVVCAAVALLQVAISLAARHAERPGFLTIDRRQAGTAAAIVTAVTLLALAVSPASSSLGDRWDSFRDPEGLDANDGSRGEQLLDSSGRGRYQLWEGAVNAFESEPLTGIGAGTFEFYWAENKTFPVFARDAHSLYLETLGEFGPIGLLLIGGFIGLVLIGPARCIFESEAENRTARAGIVAAIAVFAAAAVVDWVWELAALGGVFFVLAAVGLAASRQRRSAEDPGTPPQRLAIASTAVVGLLAVAIPLAGSTALDKSQASAAEGSLDRALEQAGDARALQPYAASPHLQAALLLEEQGDFVAAADAARRATRREPGNWRNWLTLSRLAARAGNVPETVRAYEEARRLNPKSRLFN